MNDEEQLELDIPETEEGLEEVIKRNVNTTVVTFIIGIIFYLIEISTCFRLILLRIPTYWTPKIIQMRLYSLKF